MNFLAPLFLIGGVALAGPVIFHLIRRTTRERTPFSSLMFLQPSPPRLSKRSRLEHWLLLLLRCLALGLLALGFSRPFFKETPLVDPGAKPPKRIVVLVDTSASMRRTGLWAAARDRVETILKRAEPADEFTIMTFDRQTTSVVSFEEWNRLEAGARASTVTSRLATILPGWAATHLGNALISAAEALAEPEGKRGNVDAVARFAGPRQIVLVSDLQAGSRLDTLQAYEWPKGIQITLEALKVSRPTNAGLQVMTESPDAPRTAQAVVRVRVTNSADAQREQFQVGWARADGTSAWAGAPIDIYVPPGQSRVAVVPVPKNTAGIDRIMLRGDDEDFDNIAFTIPPEAQHLNVLWLGADNPDDPRQPLFFVRRAFADTPVLAVKVVAHAASAPLLPDEVAGAALIFIADALPAGQAEALHQQVLAGKTVVFLPKTAAMAPTLGALLGKDGITLEEARVKNYAMFGEIDFRHPLLAPFADPRFSDFTKIHFWKYRRLDPATLPESHLVAKFDNGDPALVETPLGRGRVLTLTSGWQPEDSQLSISSKFVPLLYSLLDLSGSVNSAPATWVVGDKVPLPEGPAIVVHPPSGPDITLPAGTTLFAQTTQPGIYQVNAGGKTSRFAVNLDASESRTAPLTPDDLEHLGVPVAAPAEVAAQKEKESQRVLLEATEAENRQKLWRWFIAATLAVLLFETALAGWTARRLAPKPEEVTP